MLQEFDNTFVKPVCVNKHKQRKSVPCNFSTNKRLKYDATSFNKTDQTERYSSSNHYISKLKRYRDIDITPIRLHNNSDVTAFEFLNTISKPTTQKHTTDNISNQEAQETNSINERTIPKVVQNFKPSIMKVIVGLKHTLSQFKMQISNLQLKNMKNDVVNQCDAKDIVFIIGCIISKLKEELRDQEELLTMSYLQQSIQDNSKKSHLHKYGKFHHDKSYLQSESKILNKRLLESTPKMNSANWTQNNHNVFIKTKSQGDKENLSLETSYTDDTTEDANNDKVTSWNKRNLESIFSELTEINVIKKRTKKQNVQNNLKSKNFMHPAAVEPVATIERIVPCKHLTKTKKDSLEIKAPCVQLNYDSDVNSTCSTVPLSPLNNNNVTKRYKDKNSRIRENENELHDKLKSSPSYNHLLGAHIVSEQQQTNLHYCNSEETTIIPQTNKEHATGIRNEPNSSKNSSKNTEKDLEVLSVTSSVSSTFSAYILPSFPQNVTNENSSKKIGTINEGTDKKILMNCKVILEKLKV